MKKRTAIEKSIKQHKITHKQLAKHVMLPINTIKSWIEGKCEIPYSCALLIYDILSLDPEEMLKNQQRSIA